MVRGFTGWSRYQREVIRLSDSSMVRVFTGWSSYQCEVIRIRPTHGQGFHWVV
jgi:CRISPR/Cas system endoribonuclease Cas6 (RAMP superfamily)